MDIEVWSVGKAKFTADPEYQEPMIREVIDQRGDVASVIIDYTDSERSDISHDEYARVTGDVPGLVLFEGWLTGDPDTLAQIIATLAEEHQGNAGAADFERKRLAAMEGLLAEILSDLKAKDVGRRVLGQMPNGWGVEEYQVALWVERAEKAGVKL